MERCAACGAEHSISGSNACPQCGATQPDTASVEVGGILVDVDRLQIESTSTYASKWLSDARKEAAPSTDNDGDARRREIVFAACCAEAYLYEWTIEVLRQRYPIAEAVERLEADYFTLAKTSEREQARNDVLDRLNGLQERIAQGQCGTEVAEVLASVTRQIEAITETPNTLTAWKDIPKRLHGAGCLPNAGSFDDLKHVVDREFAGLVYLRNAFIHTTRLSRPRLGIADKSKIRTVSTPEGEHLVVPFVWPGAPKSGPFTWPGASKQGWIPPGQLKRIPPGWAVGVVINLLQTLHTTTGTQAPSWLVEC